MERTLYAVIPAAGIGTRVGSEIPKQYIKIGSKTLIEYTIEKLLTLSYLKKIVVVISPNDHYFKALTLSTHPKIITVLGGETRADSVLSGIESLMNQSNSHNAWVLVHDAARPCVLSSDIDRLVNTTLEHNQGGILAHRITDTVKKVAQSNDQCIEKTYDRELLWAAATPQMFPLSPLKNALVEAQNQSVSITDEASAMEFMGEHPLLIECNRTNIKVTQKEDLALATYFLTQQGCLNNNE